MIEGLDKKCYDISTRSIDLFFTYHQLWRADMETIEKIRPEEVAVLSAGEQIRRKVLGTGTTIEAFARDINFYPVSVKQYLRRDDGGSSSFKIKLTHYFSQGYDEIVKSPAEQLADKCRNLSDNIYLYTEEGDASVVSGLFGLIEEAGLDALKPWMQRNLGINRFYRNRTGDALVFLESAFRTVSGGRDILAQATFAADLALVNYYLCEYGAAYQWILLADGVLHQLASNQVLQFIVPFRRGVILTRMERYPEAVTSLKIALKTAGKETFEGIGNLYLAEAKYKCHKVKEAKACYRAALVALENDPIRQSYVYSSFAEMLLSEGDLQRAALFSEKAINLCGYNETIYSFQHFETYAKIQIRLGKRGKVCETLIEMMEMSSAEFVYRAQMLDALKILIDCFDEIEMDLSSRMEDLLAGLIERAGEDEHAYSRELRNLLKTIARQKGKTEEATG